MGKWGGLWLWLGKGVGLRVRKGGELWWEKEEGKGWVLGVKRGRVMVGKGGGLWWVEGDGYGWKKRGVLCVGERRV